MSFNITNRQVCINNKKSILFSSLLIYYLFYNSCFYRCVDALENLRSTPEAVSGYSAALAALISGVSYSSLGIPHNRGKIVFNTAEELLRSASQNNRLAIQRTQAGWLLIGAVMTLGVSVVNSLVPRMLLLWRNSFPRSAKELESEKARGDAFTWQVKSLFISLCC